MSKKMDPIDEALQAGEELKVKLADQRKAEDRVAWEQWKQNPTPETMEPLIQRFEPLIKQRARSWKAPNVNQAAMHTNMLINAVDAFQTYNPEYVPTFGKQPAALKTHLENRLQKAKRFNIQQQNYAYMPEGQVSHIGRINQAQDLLREELGREPTSKELVDHLNPGLEGRMKLTEKKVERILQGQRKDVIGSTFESDPTPYAVQREREVIGLLRPNLSADQQQVFDHLYGQSGKERIESTTQLAKVLGKSPSQISRLRTGILQKFDELK